MMFMVLQDLHTAKHSIHHRIVRHFITHIRLEADINIEVLVGPHILHEARSLEDKNSIINNLRHHHQGHASISGVLVLVVVCMVTVVATLMTVRLWGSQKELVQQQHTQQDQRNFDFRAKQLALLEAELVALKAKRTTMAEAGDRGLAFFTSTSNCGQEVQTLIQAIRLNNPGYDSFRLLHKVRKSMRQRYTGDVRATWVEIQRDLDALECVNTKVELIALLSRMEALLLEQSEFYAENNNNPGGVILPLPMASPDAFFAFER